MKRIFIIFAFIIGNSIFTSCSDLNEKQIQELDIQQEIQNTTREDGQTPAEDDEED
ncbi:hypothetical protein [uncultured Tenacibaculum sp.]|uniref:hypothetical protein n=1 Tax=uncultured Tenacibaculum sp. TaxID=174713 RepID=UPI00262B1C56|nr:hypothetical protein [uncultured Tenacibaculum sp.]